MMNSLTPDAHEKPHRRDFGDVIPAAQKLFDRHGLGEVHTIAGVLAITAHVSGLPIDVVSQPETYDGYGTAFCIKFPHRSLIVLRERDLSNYRARGLLHEVGHLIFGHPGCQLLSISPPMDGLEPAPVVQANVRALYQEDPQEREAEALAILLGRHLLRPNFQHDERVFG